MKDWLYVTLYYSLLIYYFAASWHSARHSESKGICVNVDDKRCRSSSVVIGWVSPKLQICSIWSMWGSCFSLLVLSYCESIDHQILMHEVFFGSLKWCKTKNLLLFSKLWTLTMESFLMKVSICTDLSIHMVGSIFKLQNARTMSLVLSPWPCSFESFMVTLLLKFAKCKDHTFSYANYVIFLLLLPFNCIQINLKRSFYIPVCGFVTELQY